MSEFRFEAFTLPHSDEIDREEDLTEEAMAVLDLVRQIRMTPKDKELSAIDALVGFDDRICLVARDDEGAICAAANLHPEPADDHMWVTQLAVDPDYRGQGISHEFVEHIVGMTRRAGLSKIKSRAASTAIRAHYAWGFQEDDNQSTTATPVMYRYV